MLENIKSQFFEKMLFSLLDERIRFKIIKYNKNIQNLMNINIINYKQFSGKKIVYETKGRGKEYDFVYGNSLVFEGEYLNGERVKGKEYHSGKIMYEGNFLRGKWNGNGREYNHNGKLRFEGEFLNGERLKGKEYCSLVTLVYEGEYKNNYRNGKGYNIVLMKYYLKVNF